MDNRQPEPRMWFPVVSNIEFTHETDQFIPRLILPSTYSTSQHGTIVAENRECRSLDFVGFMGLYWLGVG